MDYILVISSFISGTLIAAIAAYANQKVKQTSEDKLRLRESEYQIYLKLNDLYQWYFWFSTNELHQEKTDKMVYLECNRIALSIAQELHKNEKSEFTKDLLKILYDESIPTFDERWREMSALSDKMGAKLTPLHQQYTKSLNEKNIHLMAQTGFVPRAPASSRFRLKG